MIPMFEGENPNAPYLMSKKQLREYMFKVCHFRQMDFDLAFFVFVNSFNSPAKLYQHTKRLKQITGSWAREDPCVLAALAFLMLVIGMIYSLCFSLSFPIPFVFSTVSFPLVHFFLSGVMVS